MTRESDYMADGFGRRTCLLRSKQTSTFQYFFSILSQVASATFEAKVKFKPSLPQCHPLCFPKSDKNASENEYRRQHRPCHRQNARLITMIDQNMLSCSWACVINMKTYFRTSASQSPVCTLSGAAYPPSCHSPVQDQVRRRNYSDDIHNIFTYLELIYVIVSFGLPGYSIQEIQAVTTFTRS